MGSLREHVRPGSNTDYTVLAPTLLAPTDGGRRDKIPVTVQSLDTKRGGPDDNEAQAGHLIVGFSENQRGEVLTHETAHQLTSGGGKPGQGYSAVLGASGVIADDPLLPLGLDSHRYRCCGNGVVAPVSEWIGRALLKEIESHAA